MARSDDSGADRPDGEDRATLQNEAQVNAEFAKAFQELTRGEKTASALETRLSGIESKIEQLLAMAEAHAQQQRADGEPAGSTQSTSKPE